MVGQWHVSLTVWWYPFILLVEMERGVNFLPQEHNKMTLWLGSMRTKS